ncbi:ABC transporter ATP-binding protein [Opitutales bacterium ASA1]|uniref:ABC transporter ATP-binding protein n=1 Tax=Congregicoccus parvus TaxID=3081749 RepID=UPI002B30CF2A|nr:ABC transporter ATP-binding protein [Opitutales bacterium ASA1]
MAAHDVPTGSERSRGGEVVGIAGLVHRFGAVTALDGIDLSIREGEFFGLLGPNGAGKSTLMSVLSGFLDASGGVVEIAGVRASRSDPAWRGMLGSVPQSIALYGELSAEQNLRIFGSLYGLGGRFLRERVAEMLAAVRLDDRKRARVKTFSGGMQRRLNIAAALLHRPRVLLCDEPTVGVDPQSRHAIFELLREVNRSGTTVVYSTHYMEEAQALCGRIAIIDHGRILRLGTVAELLRVLPFEEEISCRRDVGDALRGVFGAHGDVLETDERLVLRPRKEFRLSELFRDLEERNAPVEAVQLRRPSLEAVFLHLTGRNLRE